MPSRPCILVQCHHTDLLESEFRTESVGHHHNARDIQSYSVGALASACEAPIVLAAPDVAANRQVFPALARQWGVGVFLGEEVDVVKRLLAAARSRHADTIARVVLSSFYVEPDLVRRQLETLQRSQADYCALPRDFNINFGADVITVKALQAFHRHTDHLPPGRAATARYRPWPFLELFDGLDIVWCEDTPDISAERIEWIRSHPNWPERAGPDCQGGEYVELASHYVSTSDSVLDAGCGHGEIANIISGRCARMTGVDYNEAMIELAQQRFPHCHFEAADIHAWKSEQRFDVIFHCHTLEHLIDPIAALRNLSEHLASDGKLIVEVPLEMRPGIINPHHQREYTVDLLLQQARSAGLRVLGTHGVARGIYGEPELAREAYVAVCSRDQS